MKRELLRQFPGRSTKYLRAVTIGAGPAEARARSGHDKLARTRRQSALIAAPTVRCVRRRQQSWLRSVALQRLCHCAPPPARHQLRLAFHMQTLRADRHARSGACATALHAIPHAALWRSASATPSERISACPTRRPVCCACGAGWRSGIAQPAAERHSFSCGQSRVAAVGSWRAELSGAGSGWF